MGRRWVGLCGLLVLGTGFVVVAKHPEWVPTELHVAWLERSVEMQAVVSSADEPPQERRVALEEDDPFDPRHVPVVARDRAPSRVFVSPSGGAYVILSQSDWTYDALLRYPRYLVARRAAGRPPMAAREATAEEERTESPSGIDAWVDRGDEVLSRGVLTPATTRITVLDDGDFIAVADDVLGGFLVVRRGKTQWFVRGRDAFGQDYDREFPWASRFSPVASCLEGDWFDASRQLVGLVGRDDRFVVVDVRTGRVDAVLDAAAATVATLPVADVLGRDASLEVSLRQRWTAVVEPARRLMTDETQALSTQFRAALLLADHGDMSGTSVVQAVCALPDDGSIGERDIRQAWGWLGRMLGDDARPIYVRKLAEDWDRPSSAAFDGARMGLPALGASAGDDILALVLAQPLDPGRLSRSVEMLARWREGSGALKPWWQSDWRTPDGSLATWQAFVAGDAASLRALLAEHVETRAGRQVSGWSVLVLPALVHVGAHPAPQFAPVIRDFRAAFHAEDGATPDWTSRVRAEADAALAAIAGAR